MGFMWIGGVLVMVLLVWFLITLVNRPGNADPFVRNEYRDPGPLEILKKRYARGEITKAEYDEMRQEL